MAAADHQEQVRCIMRQSLLLGDYTTAAAAISSLMLFPNPDSVFSSSAPHLKDAQQFVEVAWGLLELLRFQETNPDQMRRCLKQLVQLYASDSTHKEAFTVELVLQLWSQGDLPGAVEVLSTRSQAQHRGGWHTSFMLQALYGMASYQQWLDSAAPVLAPISSSSSASSSAAGGGRTALPPLLQQLLVLPAGRSLGDSAKSALAEKHLKGALSLSKHQPLLVLLLCQVQLAQGKPQSALRSVHSARRAMPAAADIHTLWCLIKQQPALTAVGAPLPAPARAQQQMDQQRGGRSRGLQGSQGGAGAQGGAQGAGGWWDGGSDLEGAAGEAPQPADPVHVYRDACAAAVRLDPLNWGALEGLLHVSGHCVACCQAAVAALLLHLDVTGPPASQAALQVAAAAAAMPAAVTLGIGAAGAAPLPGPDAGEAARLLSAAAAAANGAPWSLAAAVLLQLGTLAAEALAQQQQQQQLGVAEEQQQQQQQQQQQRRVQRQRAQQGAVLPGAEVLQQWLHICGPGSSNSSSSSGRGRLWQEAIMQTQEVQLLGVAACAARAVPRLPPAGMGTSQYQQELLQEQQAAAVQQAMKQGEVVVQQLVCKAMVLAHVMGPDNTYTQQLAGGLERWLQTGRQCLVAGAQEAGSSSSHGSVCRTVAVRVQEALESARSALQDCVDQATLLQEHCKQDQPHAEAGQPAGQHLGEYTDAYGAYKDLPGSWWRTFPSNLRE